MQDGLTRSAMTRSRTCAEFVVANRVYSVVAGTRKHALADAVQSQVQPQQNLQPTRGHGSPRIIIGCNGSAHQYVVLDTMSQCYSDVGVVL